jgi:hypothetical protein
MGVHDKPNTNRINSVVGVLSNTYMGRVDKKSWRTCDWELKYVLRSESLVTFGKGWAHSLTTEEGLN